MRFLVARSPGASSWSGSSSARSSSLAFCWASKANQLESHFQAILSGIRLPSAINRAMVEGDSFGDVHFRHLYARHRQVRIAICRIPLQQPIQRTLGVREVLRRKERAGERQQVVAVVALNRDGVSESFGGLGIVPVLHHLMTFGEEPRGFGPILILLDPGQEGIDDEESRQCNEDQGECAEERRTCGQPLAWHSLLAVLLGRLAVGWPAGRRHTPQAHPPGRQYRAVAARSRGSRQAEREAWLFPSSPRQGLRCGRGGREEILLDRCGDDETRRR